MLNKPHVKSQLSLKPRLLIIHSDIYLWLFFFLKRMFPRFHVPGFDFQYATISTTKSTVPGLSVPSTILALSSVCHLVLLIGCQCCCNSMNVCASVYSSYLLRRTNIGWCRPVIPDVRGWSIPSQRLVWTTWLDHVSNKSNKIHTESKKEKNNLSTFHMSHVTILTKAGLPDANLSYLCSRNCIKHFVSGQLQ